MSLKLSEIQCKAEQKGKEHFPNMVCLHATLYAVNDALAAVDDIIYVPPDVIKASNGILAGLWSSEGLCGIVLAGAMAISLKYGASNPYDGDAIYAAGKKAKDFYYWFKREYGSCNCVDMSKVSDWGDPEAIAWYKENTRDTCIDAMCGALRKLVDILTADNPKVVRNA